MRRLPTDDLQHLAARYRRTQLDLAAALMIAEAVIDLDEPYTRPTRGAAAGDTRKLRGIPVSGRGVPGAMPGTRP